MSFDCPSVVILLATRNGAKFLNQQLDSIRAQSYVNWKLLVSDDGSTDETCEIVKNFASSVTQEVVLCNGPQLGFWQNFASMVRRNDLIGDLYAYSDQDDIWHSSKLERGVEWFRQSSSSGAALYLTRTELVGQDGAPLGLSRLMLKPYRFANALVQNIGGGNTMLFNRPALNALRSTPADADLVAHDWWTYQIVTGCGGLVYYDERPSLQYRQHGANLMGQNVGFGARLARLKALLSGTLKEWNERNLAMLNRSRSILLPEHAATLDAFQAARQGSAIGRVLSLWRSGVYRQHSLDTIALYVSAIVGRL